MPTFELVIKLKLKWFSYPSGVTCQPLGHSECNKICDTDSYNEQTRKSTKNLCKKKIDQVLGFWAGQSFRYSRNTCICRFKSFLAVNAHVAKSKRLALSKMSTSAIFLSKNAHITTSSSQSVLGIWVKL